jgi:alpha/beta superfamily hydrolase
MHRRWASRGRSKITVSVSAGSILCSDHADQVPSRRLASHRSGYPHRRRGLDGDPTVTPYPAIRVSSTVTLEAKWDVPESPQRGVVLCHPHPLSGGTMTVPLLEVITEDLLTRSVAVLRFNFRGVGRSSGSHDYGLAEIDDVAAAVAYSEQEFPAIEFGIAGWSFGAGVSLRWHARDRAEINYVGIAPGIGGEASRKMPQPEILQPAHRTFIVGDRDQMISPERVIDYAQRAGATLHVLRGSDHFFYFRERKVACLVAAGLGMPVPADEIEAACR